MNFSCERISYKNVENLYAVIGSQGPTLCFLGHTDVVPTGPEDQWTHPPFSGETHDDHIYGRGAADMKGNICAFIEALDAFLKTEKLNYRIAVLLTSNEEGTPEDGFIDELLEELKARGETIDYCLVGEPSSSLKIADTIRIGRRGSLSGKLKIIGKQGHIAYPEKIINPIFLVTDLIKILKEKKWDSGNEHFQPTSFQISNINSGTGAGNIVPGELIMDFNFRFCSLNDPVDFTSSNIKAISFIGLLTTSVTGAQKSKRKALMFLIAIRSSLPRKTKSKHNRIKIKLKFLFSLNAFLFDGLDETNVNHS